MAAAKKKVADENVPEDNKAPNPEHPRKSVTQVVEVIEGTSTVENGTDPAVPDKTENVSQAGPGMIGSASVTTEADHQSGHADTTDEPEKAAPDEPIRKTSEAEKPDPESTVEPQAVVEELFSKRGREGVADIAIESTRSRQNPIVWAMIVIVTALIAGGSLYFLTRNRFPAQVNAPSPSAAIPTTAVTPQTDTPTPASALKRSDVTVQVLNGGGTVGAASKMKSFLEELGYSVTTVGNTEAYTYESTEILVKPEKSGALDLLKTDLASDYTVGEASATLPVDAPADARVIVGK
ncbi:hypothetical protein A2Z33_07120 [Candidatus Gottesmanbacteria bacterium RBG_16_52_11]|uniref:LytR/CpsA/Psr regulator C-terminal domain-containing protein n=1 Tax=Candidatus Gottesmanbacteria bacterium RBG_16_52_11 TaxID=1798374 RepID=A0A1F5YYJ0_9BACT|nr:MAG: hypothetical protein A2Z33_07120 [Candidatus Gottesmanbacteria bacterium RBG_16_52_11]